MDLAVGLRHDLEAVAVLVAREQPDGREVMRVVTDVELPAGIAAAPCKIRIACLVEDLVLQALAGHGELDAVGREG